MYSLRITKKQAQVISIACELLSRLGIGQWREILDHLPIDKISDYDQYHKDVALIGEILSKYMINNIDGWRQSLGINGGNVDDSSKMSWDIYQVIRKKLAWEYAVESGIIESEDSPRDWSKMLAVSYDNPMNISEEPLPEIERA